jgi:predicted ribosome quality control (RQC) complex YloA/Tae2 family protein
MNEAAEAFAAQEGEHREVLRLRAERERRLRRELKRVRAEEAMRREEVADERAAFLQAAGAALSAVAGEQPRGAASFWFPDPEGGPGREVVLDPALGPRQNAERLFRTARKIRRRAELARERLPGVAGRRRLLEEELAALPTLGAEALREPAAARGDAARRPAPGRAAQASPGIREYRSREGWRILVGKSGAGNDRLTGRIAAPDDWWFHARDYPGAHVVLKVGGGEPPGEALRIAGEIAAWHSGARSEGMVDVSYTRRRHVRKVKGGPPGKVLLAEASTLRVRPRVPDGVAEVKS